jgi:dTMP kinase
VRGFGIDLIEQLNDISTKKTYPNVTFLLDVDVSTGLQRREQSGKKDRLDMEAQQFHHQVREGYLKLAKENAQDRWVIVDANQPIDDVAEQLWSEVQNRLPQR